MAVHRYPGWKTTTGYASVSKLTGVAIQQALNAAPVGGFVYLGPHTYKVSTPVVVRDHARLVGDRTILQATSEFSGVAVVHVDRGEVENLKIDAANFAGRGLYAYKDYGHVVADRVSVVRAKDTGIEFVVCATATANRLIVSQCGGSGIVLRGCNALNVRWVHVSHCGGYGLEIGPSPEDDCWGGAHVEGGVVDFCDGGSLRIGGVRGDCSVRGVYFEANQGENGGGLVIGGRHAVVERCSVRGMLHPDHLERRAVWVVPTAVGARVRDCTLNYGGSGQDPPYWKWSAIRDEGVNSVVGGNGRPSPFDTPAPVEKP